MNNGFEVNTDDVVGVINLRMVSGKSVSDELVERIHGLLDHGRIEKEALRDTDLEDQIDNAWNEMAIQIEQLIKDGELPELDGFEFDWITQ